MWFYLAFTQPTICIRPPLIFCPQCLPTCTQTTPLLQAPPHPPEHKWSLPNPLHPFSQLPAPFDTRPRNIIPSPTQFTHRPRDGPHIHTNVPPPPPSLAQTVHYPLTPDAPLLMSPVSSRQQNHFHQQILLPTMSISSSTERSPVAKSQSPASYIHLHRTAPPNPTQLYAANSLRHHLHLLDSRYRLFPNRSTPHLFKYTALTTTHRDHDCPSTSEHSTPSPYFAHSLL